jgi:kynurenine formamidase
MGIAKGMLLAILGGQPALAAWTSHTSELRKVPWIVSAGLFTVLEGEGAAVVMYDVDADAKAAQGRLVPLIETAFADSKIKFDYFEEVFAAPDARPMAETDRYVFIPWPDVAADGVDDEFNTWYNGAHVPDVAGAGIVRARRFRADRESWQYFATYDMWSRDTMNSEAIKRVRGFGPYTDRIRGIRRYVLEVAARYHGASADPDSDFWKSLDGLPNNWGRWGPDDEVGSLNFLDQKEAMRGMAAAGEGKVFALGLPIADRRGDPVWPGRVETLRYNTQDRASYVYGKTKPFAGGVEYADDVAVMFLQGTTHFDALGHEWVGETIYNGYPADSTVDRLARASVDAIARRGVVGRGVLVDMARHRGKEHMERGESFSLHELLRAAGEQNLTIEKHDILIIRTGWLKVFYEQGKDAFYEKPFVEPGLSWQPEVAEWFHQMEIPAFITDTISNEGTKCADGTVRPALHIALMRNLGVTFMELAWLEELAEDCVRDGRYDFAFVAGPLKVMGGTGAPVNPIAIK